MTSTYSQSDFFSLDGLNLATAFDVPVVKERTHFLKDVNDTRRNVSETCLEAKALYGYFRYHTDPL